MATVPLKYQRSRSPFLPIPSLNSFFVLLNDLFFEIYQIALESKNSNSSTFNTWSAKEERKENIRWANHQKFQKYKDRMDIIYVHGWKCSYIRYKCKNEENTDISPHLNKTSVDKNEKYYRHFICKMIANLSLQSRTEKILLKRCLRSSLLITEEVPFEPEIIPLLA